MYSFGALLYRLCSGRPPHDGTTIDELRRQVLSERATPLAEVAPGKLVVISRSEGDVFTSDDMGKTWTDPVTFGMRMYAPKLLTLRDGTLLCLFGSYCEGHSGFRAIWSTDGGTTWTASAEDHGFIIDDSVYGYGSGVEMDDGSVWVAYYDPGQKQQKRFSHHEERDGSDKFDDRGRRPVPEHCHA